jgi:hypothetical protein
MNSIDALTFSVSGVPCTSPEPMTVTACWVSPLGVAATGPDCASQADTATAVNPAAARRKRRRFARAAIGMLAPYS